MNAISVFFSITYMFTLICIFKSYEGHTITEENYFFFF